VIVVKDADVSAVSETFHGIILKTSHRDFWGRHLTQYVHNYCVITMQDLIPRQERVQTVLRQIESDDCIAFWVTGGCGKVFLSSFCAGA
jgi:hypothetical protein